LNHDLSQFIQIHTLRNKFVSRILSNVVDLSTNWTTSMKLLHQHSLLYVCFPSAQPNITSFN